MELYASGFNAWNQLSFNSTVSEDDTEPKDLSSFTRLLEDTLIERPQARQSFTIGEETFFFCCSYYTLDRPIVVIPRCCL